MEKNSNKIKRQHGIHGLDSLPDEIIVDILSLLPLQFAVKTVILSQRWRYLWTQIDSVNIDLQLRELRNIPKLEEFLNQVLFKVTLPRIRKFQVNSTPDSFRSGGEIEQSMTRLFYGPWFSKICEYNLEEIELKHFGSAIPRLPRCLFKKTSLVSLELSNGLFLLNLPTEGDSINLPHLKQLIVQDIHTFECRSLEKFINCCPSLEDLSLISCTLPKHPFTISGMNLKRLMIGLNYCRCHGEFMIDASKLECLTVKTGSGFSLDSNDMALVEAGMERFTCTGDGWCLTSAHYVRMSTMVSSFEIEVGLQLSALIKLPYLTRLELCDDKNFCTKRFLQTLHCCPVLKILVCHFLYITNKRGGDDLSGGSIPKCLLTHIKKIEIKTRLSGLTHCRNFELTEFLLCKALVLELLIFRRHINRRCRNDNKWEELKICKKMYGCRRSSSRCKIEFSGHCLNVPKEGGTIMDRDGEMVFLK